jgi:hypothetical protein
MIVDCDPGHDDVFALVASTSFELEDAQDLATYDDDGEMAAWAARLRAGLAEGD